MKPLKVGERAAVTILRHSGWYDQEEQKYSSVHVAPPLDLVLNKDQFCDAEELDMIFIEGNWTGRESSVIVVELLGNALHDKRWPMYREVVGDHSSSSYSTDQEDQ